jgi:hypothetical protein
MFLSRPKPRHISFAGRLEELRKAGFVVETKQGSQCKVSREGCAAMVKESPEGDAEIARTGWVIGDEIGYLVDGGFQKLWKTESGKRAPALASHLSALHAFEEDLREGLGIESWFNQSLGTTCDLHLYDRVQDRDSGVPRRPWEK